MSEQVQESPATGSPFARMMGVIVSPSETFEDIARRPGWLVPFVCYIAVFLIAFSVYAMKADWITITTEQIENFPIMNMLPDEAKDQAIQQATADLKKLSQGERAAGNVLNVLSGFAPYYHGMALLYGTLFVMMGSLTSMKLGRAWIGFLKCIPLVLGFFIVAWVARIAFKDSPQSNLLLIGAAAISFLAAWTWLLNRQAEADVEFHRILSVCAYSAVISMLFWVAVMVVSLVSQAPIQVALDKLVRTNLGALLKPDSPIVRSLLESFDIFSLLLLSFMTIGFRTVTKLSTGATAAITFLPWGIYVMIKVALAAL
jgi:hypothetical protein